MKPRPPLPPGPYLVVGAGLSGQAVAPLLDDAVVVATDAERMAHLDSVGTVVKSPGIRPSVELIRTARERGLTVVGELEIAWRLLPNEFIAVTGTNGKTTTTALLGEIHRLAGVPHAVAGNIGTALSSLVGAIDPDAVVICECSSFQLADSLEFSPECALLLNVDADHLDWHGSVEAYRAAKARIFLRQQPGDVAVVPPGYAGELRATRIEYEPALPSEVRLRGRHNLANAGAARAVARARRIDDDAIAEALRTFAGVPHRLEEVAVVGGVTYINDSKATNVGSTLMALEALERDVHVILGGDDAKGEDFSVLRELVAQTCAAAYLIGEAAPRLRSALDGTVPLHESETLDVAVATAATEAAPGQTVLLSPACASYDQFKNFEDRGDRFRKMVEKLSD
ncbi:MAG: UDP-N-acetylmuramoylalanine--D-glutamate ligase [Thermoleophilaceae bacterium]|jgi:UDP-N-acetylmuramoylalanine--D-glutamate ligase|nr:UDP-N-acetylmuramoylalanine--D-glutamate ligase [Thermoleophilaceae bacterium]